MAFVLNEGPSFNVLRAGSSYPLLSGFGQRFDLLQSDPRFTPGKAPVHLPAETMKGTFKVHKANRKPKPAPKRACPVDTKPQPIYGGFANVKPEDSKPRKRKRKKRRKRVKK